MSETKLCLGCKIEIPQQPNEKRWNYLNRNRYCSDACRGTAARGEAAVNQWEPFQFEPIETVRCWAGFRVKRRCVLPLGHSAKIPHRDDRGETWYGRAPLIAIDP